MSAGAKRLSDVACECTDVCAGAAGNSEVDYWIGVVGQLYVMDCYCARFSFDNCFCSCILVQFFPSDFESSICGGNLLDSAGELLKSFFYFCGWDLFSIFTFSYVSCDVICVACCSQCNFGFIGFWQRMTVLHEPCRWSYEYQQYAGGEGVKCAGVAYPYS